MQENSFMKKVTANGWLKEEQNITYNNIDHDYHSNNINSIY